MKITSCQHYYSDLEIKVVAFHACPRFKIEIIIMIMIKLYILPVRFLCPGWLAAVSCGWGVVIFCGLFEQLKI